MVLSQLAKQLAYIALSDHISHFAKTYHLMDPQPVCVDLFPYGSSGLCLCTPVPIRVITINRDGLVNSCFALYSMYKVKNLNCVA